MRVSGENAQPKRSMGSLIAKDRGLDLMLASVVAGFIGAGEYLILHNTVWPIITGIIAIITTLFGAVLSYSRSLIDLNVSLTEDINNITKQMNSNFANLDHPDVFIEEKIRPLILLDAINSMNSARNRIMLVQGTPSIFFKPHNPGKDREEELKTYVFKILNGKDEKCVNEFLLGFSVYDRHFQAALDEMPSEEKIETVNMIIEYLKNSRKSNYKTFTMPNGHYVSFSFMISDDVLTLWLNESKIADGKWTTIRIEDKGVVDYLYRKYKDFCTAQDEDDAIALLKSKIEPV